MVDVLYVFVLFQNLTRYCVMHDIHNAYIHVQVMLYIMSYIMYGPMKSTHVIVGGVQYSKRSRQRTCLVT